jgi:hypothetical protein
MPFSRSTNKPLAALLGVTLVLLMGSCSSSSRSVTWGGNGFCQDPLPGCYPNPAVTYESELDACTQVVGDTVTVNCTVMGGITITGTGTIDDVDDTAQAYVTATVPVTMNGVTTQNSCCEILLFGMAH